ncbi:unnamed protein product [Effrenium voratum]|uniref:Uncharacterized protein n=1 Tax=Effrenium voratum TaxID=2562239 RepID=A0AA36I1Y5_9DINO|nr:unnamed protein product [Effrenium voratum]CAJ1436822.1 unnamed protein product [Effrenium voratum]|mmetsp:Transcript_132825/g.314808  ORF Transcript_132825/g.314808 Transcript_132825/m.314808 type:complete len:101 (-) Transcript_132825:119-421(-)
MARSTFLPLVLLGLCALCAWNCTPSTFVAPRGTEVEVGKEQKLREGVALGLSAGLLTAEPAYANVFYDEILPYSLTISFAIIWGIILGFVLLRLQEAFPE